jgi:hypothetical protein
MPVNIDEDLISIGCETADRACFKANILSRSCLLIEWYIFYTNNGATRRPSPIMFLFILPLILSYSHRSVWYSGESCLINPKEIPTGMCWEPVCSHEIGLFTWKSVCSHDNRFVHMKIGLFTWQSLCSHDNQFNKTVQYYFSPQKILKHAKLNEIIVAPNT